MMSRYTGHDWCRCLVTATKQKPGRPEKHPGFTMCGLRYQTFRQPIDRIALTGADKVTVDPEGDASL